MASEVSICNSAMQKVGAARITSLTQEDSRSAASCNACYTEMRDFELRAHSWNFAILRAYLAPDSAAPTDTDYAYQFTLPTDCLRVLPPARNSLDWQIENSKILTNDGTSILVRYISRVTDPNAMDVLYREMLACRIAIQTCEELTGSAAKLQAIEEQYKQTKREARKSNAFEKGSESAPDDDWDLARL